ncbi:MAG: hypothetical protein E7256_15790 [Lachnospiraceae bacterium]|nr:hypothetical protein [Lachnospiraceae bacterium]
MFYFLVFSFLFRGIFIGKKERCQKSPSALPIAAWGLFVTGILFMAAAYVIPLRGRKSGL